MVLVDDEYLLTVFEMDRVKMRIVGVIAVYETEQRLIIATISTQLTVSW